MAPRLIDVQESIGGWPLDSTRGAFHGHLSEGSAAATTCASRRRAAVQVDQWQRPPGCEEPHLLWRNLFPSTLAVPEDVPRACFGTRGCPRSCCGPRCSRRTASRRRAGSRPEKSVGPVGRFPRHDVSAGPGCGARRPEQIPTPEVGTALIARGTGALVPEGRGSSSASTFWRRRAEPVSKHADTQAVARPRGCGRRSRERCHETGSRTEPLWRSTIATGGPPSPWVGVSDVEAGLTGALRDVVQELRLVRVESRDPIGAVVDELIVPEDGLHGAERPRPPKSLKPRTRKPLMRVPVGGGLVEAASGPLRAGCRSPIPPWPQRSSRPGSITEPALARAGATQRQIVLPDRDALAGRRRDGRRSRRLGSRC